MREYFDHGRRRLWFEAGEIESMMESELRRAALMPTSQTPAVDIEMFISHHLKVKMDQYADGLDRNTLGLTEFLPDGECRILINRKLSEEIDREDECPAGVRGRWRATMSHEASHVLMHRTLFLNDSRQGRLFDSPAERSPPSLLRCSKRDVAHVPHLRRGPGQSAPEEVQANLGMAALLMPRSLFRALASAEIKEAGFGSGILPYRDPSGPAVVAALAKSFEVSKQAAEIRLQTLGLLSKEGELGLA